MTTTLGIVPVNRCEGLALLPFGREPLFGSCVRTCAQCCDTTMVLTASQRRGRFKRALHALRLSYDVAATPVDDDVIVAALASHDVALVLDPLCPLTPADFVRGLADRAATGATVVAVRPVVDTLKATSDQTVTGTIDRERLAIVASPVATPAATLARVVAEHGSDVLGSASELVAALRALGPVDLERAPASARRIEDQTALALMTSVDAVGHRLRER